MRKLDRTQPFGEIYGSSDARYEQHGIQFDFAGKELPGFESVVVPDQPAIVVCGDDSALQAEIIRLNGVVASLTADNEDKDAAFEDAQGKLDTANIQNTRLQAEVERLLALVPLDAADASPAATGSIDVNQQLNLQAGSADPAPKKGK